MATSESSPQENEPQTRDWEYPQEDHDPPTMWKDAQQGYPALPVGKNYDRFFGILKLMGKPVPETYKEREFDRAWVHVYNEIYDKAKGLLVHRAQGTPVSSRESQKREKKHYLVLGLPDKPPTEEQVKIVADMLGVGSNELVYIDIGI